MSGREEWCILSVQLWGGFLNWRNVTKTDLMLSRHSVTPWSVVVIGSALSYLWFIQEYATPPHFHPISRYIITRDESTRPPPMLVLQETNAGMRRPGYEAMWHLPCIYLTCDECSKAFPVFWCSSIYTNQRIKIEIMEHGYRRPPPTPPYNVTLCTK